MLGCGRGALQGPSRAPRHGVWVLGACVLGVIVVVAVVLEIVLAGVVVVGTSTGAVVGAGPDGDVEDWKSVV